MSNREHDTFPSLLFDKALSNLGNMRMRVIIILKMGEALVAILNEFLPRIHQHISRRDWKSLRLYLFIVNNYLILKSFKYERLMYFAICFNVLV
jgi:hypothetical protein